MKKLASTILLSILFIQCQNAEKKEVETKENSIETTKIIEKVKPLNIEMKELPISEVPKDFKYEGKLQFAKTVTDKLGKHTILYCLTGEMPSKKILVADYEKDTYLYIYDYLENKKLNWKIQDNIQNCEFDLGMDFVKKAVTATDLDKNGLAEIWNMYHMTCTSDVSPDFLKIIMYEGQKKYALRGDEFVEYPTDNGTVTEGGTYKMDEAFLKSPKVFQDFAQELWTTNNRLRSY